MIVCTFLLKNTYFNELEQVQYTHYLKILLDDDKLAPINDFTQGMKQKEDNIIMQYR